MHDLGKRYVMSNKFVTVSVLSVMLSISEASAMNSSPVDPLQKPEVSLASIDPNQAANGQINPNDVMMTPGQLQATVLEQAKQIKQLSMQIGLLQNYLGIYLLYDDARLNEIRALKEKVDQAYQEAGNPGAPQAGGQGVCMQNPTPEQIAEIARRKAAEKARWEALAEKRERYYALKAELSGQTKALVSEILAPFESNSVINKMNAIKVMRILEAAGFATENRERKELNEPYSYTMELRLQEEPPHYEIRKDITQEYGFRIDGYGYMYKN